jgi:copper chaperone CopZ
MKKLKYRVEGMHCGACAGNVEKAVSKVEGVKHVSVSMMTNKAIIEASDETSEEEIRKAISNVGYKVS